MQALDWIFCFIQLKTRMAVDQVTVDQSKWKTLLSNAWSRNLFIFEGTLCHDQEVYARMFAPALGIGEDPATGSAVAALVGVAAKRSNISNGEFRLNVLQGVAMGRKSEMQASATLDNGQVFSVSVGGANCYYS